MSSRNSVARWYGLAIVVGGCIAFLLTYSSSSIKPLWFLLGLLVLTGAATAFLKYPVTALIPVIFIPQWKDLSLFQGLQNAVDLTLVALIFLCVTLLFVLFNDSARGWTIRKLFWGQRKGVLAFFAFAGVVSLSYFYTRAPNWGFTELSRLSCIGGLLFLSPFILVKQERDFRQFVKVFVCFAVILALQLFFWPRYAVTAEGWAYTVQTDIGGGWILGMALLLLFYYHLTDSPFSNWLWRLLCAPPLVAGLVAATSRGPMLSLLLVFILIPIVLWKRARKEAKSKAFITVLVLFIALVAGAVSYSLLPETAGKYQEKTGEMAKILQGEWPGGTVGERLNFYHVALREIPERPLLGLGVGGWSTFYMGKDMRSYPHNLILLVAVEQGLLGIVVLFAFLWIVGQGIKKIIDNSGDRFVALFALVTFSLAVSMFSGDLDTNRLLWFWCGMALAFARLHSLSLAAEQTWCRRIHLSQMACAFEGSSANRLN